MKRLVVLSILVSLLAPSANAQGTRLIDRAKYADHLRGMWLGECIAN